MLLFYRVAASRYSHYSDIAQKLWKYDVIQIVLYRILLHNIENSNCSEWFSRQNLTISRYQTKHMNAKYIFIYDE